MRKRQRTSAAELSMSPPHSVTDDAFINDHDARDSGADDDDDEDKPKNDKKAGRRKIKIEFIQDKSRRHITFSKRKAGIMKKAYELSTLTGTQVLLLVVSETGLVYTFTTAKLQPLVTQPEGKNLIQACLNAPQGVPPSNMPVGPPMGRPIANPGPPPNVPGGLSISAGSKDDEEEEEENSHTGRPAAAGDKRRRRADSNANGPPPPAPMNRQPSSNNSHTSPTSPHATIPPQQQQQLPINTPTSPSQGVPPSPQYGASNAYGHQDPSAMYGGQQQQQHMVPQPYGYQQGQVNPAAPQHWQAPGPPAQQLPQQQQQGGHYGRR